MSVWKRKMENMKYIHKNQLMGVLEVRRLKMVIGLR